MIHTTTTFRIACGYVKTRIADVPSDRLILNSLIPNQKHLLLLEGRQ